MRLLGRLSYGTIAALLTLAILLINLRLYVPGGSAYGPDRLGPDVEAQLHFVGAALRDGAALAAGLGSTAVEETDAPNVTIIDRQS